MKRFLAAIALLASSIGTYGQLYEVPLNQRVQNSNLIVEGKVLSSYSLWDNNNANIYTVNEVQVSKVFKGSVTTSNVNIITYGGIVGTQMERVSNSLILKAGEVGLFTLKTSSLPLNVTGTIYEVYADLQGCMRYDKYTYEAKGPFDSFSNVDNALYPAIEQLTGVNHTVKTNLVWKVKAPVTSSKLQMATKTISNFTPTTATAGTGTTITINGTNFGATTGTVGFSDANDGGSSFFDCLETQIISWSNTQIVVEVPDRAGTGPIRVIDATATNTFVSSGDLTVPYAQLNIEYDPLSNGTEYAYQTQHIDDDANGGYTWQYFTDFAANTSAVSSFERALSTWTDTTCINWTIGATSAIDVIANDGVNIVRFDNTTELPTGVLGRCTSRYSGCFGTGVNMFWYVSELDIVFDDDATWEFGPALPTGLEYDFESVAVHELGHGHQLGHVINTNMVMHYAISNAEANRDLHNDEVSCGLDIMSRSTSSTVCGNSLMTEHSSCAVCTDPDSPTLGLTDAAICNGNSTTLTITGNLNDATTWEVYTVSCGGTTEGSTTGSSLSVSPTSTTTYFVRGEGGCVSPGSCASITLTVNDLPNLSVTSSTGETCTGNDGTATVTPSGAGGYGYVWDAASGNQTNQTATGLAAGTYGVIVTDANTCSNSTTVTVNDDCTIPTTNLKPVYCGTTPGVNDYLQVVSVSGATDYEYLITNQTTLTQVTFFRGNGLTNFRTQWIPSFDFGTTYSIEVRAHIGANVGTFGSACLISTPSVQLSELQPAYCGFNATSMYNYIYAKGLVGSQDYRYRFSEQGGSDIIVHDRGFNSVQLRLSWVPGLKYGSTYDVEVAVLVNGSYTAYGNICTVTMPSFPTTQLQSSSCDITLSSLAQTLYPIAVAGAEGYQYEWVPQGGGTTLTYTKNSSQASMKPYNVTGIQTGVVYDVRVAAIVGGDTGTYGNICTINTGVAAMPTLDEILAAEDEYSNNLDSENNNIIENIEPKVVLSPNPNAGNFLKIDYDGEKVIYDMEIFDLTGKRVSYSGNIGQSGNSTMINFDENLSNGIYMVRIVFEDQTTSTTKLLIRN